MSMADWRPGSSLAGSRAQHREVLAECGICKTVKPQRVFESSRLGAGRHGQAEGSRVTCLGGGSAPLAVAGGGFSWSSLTAVRADGAARDCRIWMIKTTAAQWNSRKLPQRSALPRSPKTEKRRTALRPWWAPGAMPGPDQLLRFVLACRLVEHMPERPCC